MPAEKRGLAPVDSSTDMTTDRSHTSNSRSWRRWRFAHANPLLLLLIVWSTMWSIDGPEVRPMIDEQSSSEALRRLGSASAPWQADFILDMNCAHCADVFSATINALQPSVEAGSVEVVVRWWLRPRDPVASDLIAHVLAAENRAEFRLLTSLVVGTPVGRGWQILRPRLSELIDPSAIEQRLETHRAAIEHVMQTDAARIQALSVTTVPTMILSDRNGVVQGRWEGKRFTIEDLARQLSAGMLTPEGNPNGHAK